MQKNHVVKAGAATLGTALALLAAQVATAAAPRADAAGAAKVSVTVQGRSKTLLPAVMVRPPAGWVTRGGAAKGKCPADSAQGALNAATHGSWKGKWYASYSDYYITGILGDNETGKKYYWGLYVNGKLASKGACEVRLKAGEKLLFKVTKG